MKYKRLNKTDLCVVTQITGDKWIKSIGLVTSTRLSKWGRYDCLVNGKVYNFPSTSIKYIKDYG